MLALVMEQIQPTPAMRQRNELGDEVARRTQAFWPTNAFPLRPNAAAILSQHRRHLSIRLLAWGERKGPLHTPWRRR